VCGANAIFSTALVKICIYALPVITKGLGGIAPEIKTWRTQKAGAHAFHVSARVAINVTTGRVLAKDGPCIGLQEVGKRRLVCVARGTMITTSIPVNVRTGPTLATYLMSIWFRNMTAWARKCMTMTL
jgi:hypothetical protein